MRRMNAPQTLHIRTRWTTTSDAPCRKLQRKPKTTDELKVSLHTVWEELPQEHVNRAATNFTKCLTAYMAASDVSFKHLQQLCPSLSLHPFLITNKLVFFQTHEQTTTEDNSWNSEKSWLRPHNFVIFGYIQQNLAAECMFYV